MSNDRLARAVELWERFPDSELTRFNLVQALVDAGDHEAAVEHLRVLCANRSDWMVAHILLGKSLLALRRADEARLVLQVAHQLAVIQQHDGPRAELEELLQTL